MQIKGLTVHKVLVVPAADIATESYVGLIMDRETQRPVFMVSSAGGVDIEEVAAKTPEKIVRLPVDPTYGLFPHQALRLAFVLYRDFAQVKAAAKIMEQLYTAFVNNGASLAEINPLVTTPEGRVLALDAKIVIDDNELFWRPDLGVLRDDSAEEPSEAAARRANLTFIKLDGNVGCVVNGANRKSTRLNSSHPSISYAVFCLKKKKNSKISDVYPLSFKHPTASIVIE